MSSSARRIAGVWRSRPWRFGRAVIGALWFVLLSNVALAEPTPLGLPPGGLEIGDRGFFRTVIEDGRFEEVPIVYLGTTENASGPGFDLYLVRLQGPIGEKIGVASGMSGSPVYFEGHLVGALSYSLGAFPEDPIGGVTPIEDVLAADRAPASVASDGALRPLATPVSAGGLAPRVRDWLVPQLEAVGLRWRDGAVVGGARRAGAGRASAKGADAQSPDPPFLPGSPVGIGLVTGDLSFGATGTVTWVEGERVFAFGHPFVGQGRVALPLNRAHVFATLADRAGSFKISDIGAPVGALVEDRLTAIVGDTSTTAETFAVDVVVDHAVDREQRRFHYDVALDSPISALLSGTAVFNSLAVDLGYDRDEGLVAQGTVRLRDGREIPMQVAASGGDEGAPGPIVAQRVQGIVEILRTNRFGPLPIDAIEISVSADSATRAYRLRSLLYDRDPVAPGDTLTVTAVLERAREAARRVEFDVTLPADLDRSSDWQLVVGPPGQIDRAAGGPSNGRLATAVDETELIEALTELGSPHRLQATLMRRSTGVVVQGEHYADLPPTAARLLGAKSPSTRSRRVNRTIVAVDEVELDGPVSGGLIGELVLRSARAVDEESR